MTIYYQQNEQFEKHFDVSELIESATPQSSNWLNGIPPIRHGFKTLKEWFLSPHSMEGDGTPSTIRMCPGIKTYLDKCILVKFPHELLLQTTSQGQLKWQVPQNNKCNIVVEAHYPDQYSSTTSDLFNDKINIKFVLPLNIHVDKDNYMMPQVPYYHANVPYDIMPGIITNRNIVNETAINAMFPKIDAVYHFKQGSPFLYIYNLKDNRIKLKANKNNLARKTFLNNLNRNKNV